MTTRTAAVRLDGLIEAACQASCMATDAAWLAHSIATRLVPSRRAGDIVTLEDRSSHESAGVARRIESAGAPVRCPPA